MLSFIFFSLFPSISSATKVSHQYYLTISPADGHLYLSDPEKYQVKFSSCTTAHHVFHFVYIWAVIQSIFAGLASELNGGD